MSWTFKVGQRFVVKNPVDLGVKSIYSVGETVEIVFLNPHENQGMCKRGCYFLEESVTGGSIVPVTDSWLHIARELGFAEEDVYHRLHVVEKYVEEETEEGRKNALLDSILLLHLHEKGAFDA